MPVSGHVFRLDFVPVSFSSFPFLREGITLLQSCQDGVAGTVTSIEDFAFYVFRYAQHRI